MTPTFFWFPCCEDEKGVFLKLISVSGIGPTAALAIVAVDDNQGLVAAIDNSDVKYLMKFQRLRVDSPANGLDLAGNLQVTNKRPRRCKSTTKEIISWMKLWKALASWL